MSPTRRKRGIDLVYRLVVEARLIWRLIRDRRVPLYWKLIPAAVVGYLLIPFNILAPLDDIAITWIGLAIFVEVCPPEVVAEQRAELERVIPGKWKE